MKSPPPPDPRLRSVGPITWLIAGAFWSALFGVVCTSAVYAFWLWVIKPDLEGKTWTWLFEIPGPFTSRWWNLWLWSAGLMFVFTLPHTVRMIIQHRRRPVILEEEGGQP